ncbi:MAG: glycoside hydrolase family 88 protein [Oscillospiraceae bacterium]|nr:glycoside hydrolase family 88 protein [Oscillospiraceae bacterium]
MKIFTKRILGLILAAVMVLQLMPINILSVSAAENQQIVAEKTTLTIYEEQKLSVSGTVLGEAEWSSSDPGVVSVDAQGKIKGLKAGTATVTLSVNGAASDSIAITVSPLTNYRLKGTSGTVTFADGIERLSGKATIAELYANSSFGTRVQLAEGVFSTDVTMPADNGFRLMFGRSGSANYYSFRVLKNGETSLIKTASSKETTLATKTLSAFTAGQVYNVKIVMQKVGTALQIDCFVDGKFCVSYTDESPLTGTYLGVRLNTSATTVYGYFTNFYVRRFRDALSAAEMEKVIDKVYDYTSENLFSYNNNWIEATYYLGVVEAFRATGDMKYYDSAYDYAEAFNWKVNQDYLTGYMDDLAVGLVYAQLHDIGSDGYDYKLDSAKQQFDYNVSRGYYDYSWIDEIYMGGFTAEYLSRVTGDTKYSDMNVTYYNKWHDKLFDTTDGLWYRDSKYIYGNGNAQSTSPNGKKVYWSRGNTWVYVSLAQQLQDMPKDHPAYATYVSDFVAMSAALKERQRADGFWTANLADPEHIPGRESTGTGGFLYGLAVGLELGILDYDTYYPVAKKAYQGMSAYAVKPNGMLGYCQPVGESPASATSEQTNLFGIGLFLMGASKLMTLCEDYDCQIPDVSYAEHDPSKAVCDIESGYYTGGVQSIIATNIASTENGNGVENLMNFNWGGQVSGARWSAKKEDDAQYAEVLIALNDTLNLDKMVMVAFQHRAYAFTIETSVDRENWVTVADNMSGQIVSGDNYMTTIALDQAVMTRYIRLRVKDCLNESTSWISIKGLVLYGDVVAEDPVPTKTDLTGTYKWSSTTSNVANSPQAAFDGNQETRWCAAGAKVFPASLSVDLGSVQDITKINTYFEQDSQWEYTIFGSVDGEEWSVFGTNPAGIPKQKDYTNENTMQARYVKLEITAAGLDPNGSPCWASVYEMEVFGADASKNLALKKPCGANSISSTGASVEAAFDGNVNTRYCAAGSAMPQTVQVDLGKPHTLNSIYVMFEQYSNFAYTVETSLNGKDWDTFAVSSGANVFEVTHHGQADAQYVRLVVTGSTGGAWASIREIELFAQEKDKAVATVGGENYTTVQAAVDAANGGVVTLLADSQEAITAEDLYLDLNGHSLSKVTVTGTLYGMDSATNGYTASGAKIETLEGNYAPLYRNADAKRYMAIAEGEGVSFHRFYLGITTVSLDPAVVGFGYKAEFYGDAAVQAKIASVGYNLWLTENLVVTRTTAFKNVLTLRLKNFDVVNYGETPVNANVMITLTDGTVIESETTSYSMRQMLELVAENFESFTKTKKQAVQVMCRSLEAVQSWNIAPILNWSENVALTTTYFTEIEGGKYALSTDAYTDDMVDAVVMGDQSIRAKSYRVKGTLSLTQADTWGQARILVTADANNAYVIALEKVGENAYQIFTMSRLNEGAWNDWRLISHSQVNGSRSSIDFELVVDGGKIAFLVDNQICYETSRVAISESTPGFGASNVANATISNLEAQVFTSSADAQAYLATKSQAEYVSRFQIRMNTLYNEYMTEHGCAGKGGTLILGDSNMDFWDTWQSQSGLTQYVNGYNVGIGGTTTRDWLHAYDQLIKPFHADRFVIMLGYNDVQVWGDDGEEVVENLRTLFAKIHADHPDAEIYYIYVAPCPKVYSGGEFTSQKMRALASGSRTLCEGLDYVQGVDVMDVLTTADGQNSNSMLFAADNIHMNEAGYKAFSDYLYQIIFRGEQFGTAAGYKTSKGVELTADKGEDASITMFGGAPQYAYWHDVFTDQLCFETEIQVSAVLNNDAWPKFGLLINGQTEMVKFFVDMKPNMTATNVGVVYQPTGGGDDWAGSKSVEVPGMSFTGSDTIKLKLVREGQAYYFYVNDVLVLSDEAGFKNENGAVGIFSFNTELTASNYTVLVGEDALAQ